MIENSTIKIIQSTFNAKATNIEKQRRVFVIKTKNGRKIKREILEQCPWDEIHNSVYVNNDGQSKGTKNRVGKHDLVGQKAVHARLIKPYVSTELYDNFFSWILFWIFFSFITIFDDLDATVWTDQAKKKKTVGDVTHDRKVVLNLLNKKTTEKEFKLNTVVRCNA